jgi:DNA repair exonuclease SbcCD ATPase subunit/predicted MPP superfamily phosphohydrolase
MKTKNPLTSRQIDVDGPSFNKLLKEGYSYNSSTNTLHSTPSSTLVPLVTPQVTLVTPAIQKPLDILPDPEFTPLTPDDLIPKALNINVIPAVIVHISDVHIPINLHIKRYDEYTKVFDNLYSELHKLPANKLIIVTGDLVNTKLRTDNETLIMAQNFLSSLSSIAETIVIIGNHDFAENNLDRVDSIEAICNALPKIHVLKHTGIYTINGMYFVFNSLFDLKFIHRDDVHTDLPVYALYHGSLVGASMDNGTLIRSPRSKKYPVLSDFDGYDAVLLGHIHKFQKIRPHIAYAGSLIQQNFGETVMHHGMLLWDTTTHTSIHTEISNPYAYVTLTIDDGKLLDEDLLQNIASKCLRVRYCKTKNTTPSQQEAIEQRLAKTYNICESTYKSQEILKSSDIEAPRDIAITIDTELQLITEMCDSNVRDKVSALHRELFLFGAHIKNISVWKPLSMEYKNVFIYGNDHTNKINFVTGVTDICAPNTHGKSSIVYSLLFALYDGLSMHSDKKTDILHKNALDGYIDLTILCNGQKYTIRKNITAKNGSVTYKTQFHSISSDGSKKCLNGTSETSTIKEIEKYVGKLQQFINNNIISTKQGSSSLLTMGQTEQTKHFHTICNLSHYEEYLNECKKRHKVQKDILVKHSILSQSLQSRLSSLDNSKLLTEVEMRKSNVLSSELVLHDLKLSYNQTIDRRAVILANIHILKSQLDGFESNLSKEELINKLGSINTKLDSYSPELKSEASKWTLSLLTEQIHKSIVRSTPIDISEVNRNIAMIQSAIENHQTTSGITRDFANQTLGSLQNQLRDKVSTLADYHKKLTLLPSHSSDIDSLVIEQLSLEDDIAAIGPLTHTINDIPYLQSITSVSNVTSVNGVDKTSSIEKRKLIQDKLTIIKHQRNEFQGTRKITHMLISDLLITEPVPVDLERSLPTDHVSRRKDLENKIRLISKPKDDYIHISNDKKYVPFDDSQILLFDNSKFIPLDINDNYTHAEHNRSTYEEYERLVADIEHNQKVHSDIRQNIIIQKHNDDIRSQIRWLQYQELSSEIDALTKEDKELEIYINNLENIETLNKLYKVQKLQTNLRTVTDKIAFIEYVELAKVIELEISHINSQITCYENVLQWYYKYDLLHDELSKYDAMKLQYETQNRLTALREYHTILDHIDQQTHLATHLSAWDKTAELATQRILLDSIAIELSMLVGKIAEQEQLITAEQKKITELNRDINDYNTLQIDISKYASEILILESHCAVYAEYERLFNITGIPSVLLSRKLKLFSDTVNDIFQKYTKYSFECNLENTGGQKQKIDIVIHNRTDNTELEYTRLSGFESVLLNISLNKAILDIDTSFRPGVFIIDESLDCIDQDRFIRCLPTIFDVLKSHFNTILVISHRDIPRDIIDNKISIINRGPYSMIE